jgi:hypothetical protein
LEEWCRAGRRNVGRGNVVVAYRNSVSKGISHAADGGADCFSYTTDDT